MQKVEGAQPYDVLEKLALFETYYKTLYSSEEVVEQDLGNFFGNHHVKILREDQKISLEKPIQLIEIQEGIKYLKQHKTPATDGLTGEFYTQFQDQLLQPLQLVFSECLTEDKIPDSWSRGKDYHYP